MNIPKLNKVLETALYVENLGQSYQFYHKIFGFELIFSNDILYALNVSDKQVLLLFLKGASIKMTITLPGEVPGHDGKGELHLAFSIDIEVLEHWKNWLKKNEIEIESIVKWPKGGTSLYFRDPDNHSLELATPGLWSIY